MTFVLQPQGNLLFNFVVLADTHVNQSDDKASSFFPLNRLANGRAREAVCAAASLRPAFVVHVGDIVHPIPCHPGFDDAAANWSRLASSFECPVHLIPGNHDIGDKPWSLAPVAGIEERFIAEYERVFGPQWQRWDEGQCAFYSLNTSLLNSGLPDEARQRDWFERELSDTPPQRRKFLALHYPPYLTDVAEPANYDNLDEPARSWLLELVAGHEFEAVFCGHVHNFWYYQHGRAEVYLLPSTAFVRQDYSELQRVCPPGPEGGRQDVAKLGYFHVAVYELGHVARFIHAGNPADAALQSASPHPKKPVLPNLGVDLAYPWAEEVELPPNAALDEFGRKRVRNDYPLLALMELGMTLLRMPIEDLDDERRVSRLLVLARTGFRAQFVCSSGSITPRQAGALRALGSAVTAIEVILHEERFNLEGQRLASAVAAAAPTSRLLVSKLRRPSDAAVDGLTYGHLVFHGWVPDEAERAAAAVDAAGCTDMPVAAVVRCRAAESPLDLAAAANGMRSDAGIAPCLIVRCSGDDPAGLPGTDLELVERILETAIAAWRYPEIEVIIDGLVDVDRGYFMRLGLVDRSFNARPAAHVLRRLQTLMLDLPPGARRVSVDEFADERRFRLQVGDALLTVTLPRRTGLAEGAHAFVVRATDAAGGVHVLTPGVNGGEPLSSDSPIARPF